MININLLNKSNKVVENKTVPTSVLTKHKPSRNASNISSSRPPKRQILKFLGTLFVGVLMLIFLFFLVDYLLFAEGKENKIQVIDSHKLNYQQMGFNEQVNYQISFYNKVMSFFSEVLKSDLIWDQLLITIPNKISFKGSFFKGEKNIGIYKILTSKEIKVVKSKQYSLGELVQGFLLEVTLKKMFMLRSVNRVPQRNDIELEVDKWKELVKDKSLQLISLRKIGEEVKGKYENFYYSAQLETDNYQNLVFLIQEIFLGYAKIGILKMKITPKVKGVKVKMTLVLTVDAL